jgi:hypothetical protein
MKTLLLLLFTSSFAISAEPPLCTLEPPLCIIEEAPKPKPKPVKMIQVQQCVNGKCQLIWVPVVEPKIAKITAKCQMCGSSCTCVNCGCDTYYGVKK